MSDGLGSRPWRVHNTAVASYEEGLGQIYGRRVRRSTGTTGRTVAVALEAEWTVEAYCARLWEAQPSRDFEALMAAYVNATAGDRRPRSEEALRMQVRRLRGVARAAWHAADRSS